MNNEEIKSLIEQLKATGLKDEEIMDIFWETFTKGEMDRKDLETLANAMGYELTDDFKNDEHPDPISLDDTDGLSKEDLEDAKEIQPGESKEEFQEKIGDMSKVDGDEDEEANTDFDSEDEEDENETSDSSEDEENDEDWEEAQKLFKI